jgi:hypothetical protein
VYLEQNRSFPSCKWYHHGSSDDHGVWAPSCYPVVDSINTHCSDISPKGMITGDPICRSLFPICDTYFSFVRDPSLMLWYCAEEHTVTIDPLDDYHKQCHEIKDDASCRMACSRADTGCIQRRRAGGVSNVCIWTSATDWQGDHCRAPDEVHCEYIADADGTCASDICVDTCANANCDYDCEDHKCMKKI